MRFNPPPNWPAPPAGWQPPEGWQPDPAWPAPPEGWDLFVDDETEAPPDPDVVRRPQSVGEEGEYFGTDRAWSDTGANAAEIPAPAAGSEPSPVEVMPDQLSAEHLGRAAAIRWEDDQRYEIGTIGGISADVERIRVQFNGFSSTSFLRKQSPDSPPNPRLYVWL